MNNTRLPRYFAHLANIPNGIQLQNVPENDAWAENNSSFADYCEQSGLLGAEQIIRRQLGRIGTGVALDIAGGADGVALQDLLADGQIDKALLTNYYDTRGKHAKNIGALAHIAGDILRPGTWETISEWQACNAPEGFSLIMHRPFGALQHLPIETYQAATHQLLDLLRPGGMLFAQIPMSLQPWLGGRLDQVCAGVRGRDDIDRIYTPGIVQPLTAALVIKAGDY